MDIDIRGTVAKGFLPGSSLSHFTLQGAQSFLFFSSFKLDLNCFHVAVSQDALLNANRVSLYSLFLLGSQVYLKRKYPGSVWINLFLINLTVLYLFSFKAWARVLCIVKTAVMQNISFPAKVTAFADFYLQGSLHIVMDYLNILATGHRILYAAFFSVLGQIFSGPSGSHEAILLLSCIFVAPFPLGTCTLARPGTSSGCSCFIVTRFGLWDSLASQWACFLPFCVSSQFLIPICF